MMLQLISAALALAAVEAKEAHVTPHGENHIRATEDDTPSSMAEIHSHHRGHHHGSMLQAGPIKVGETCEPGATADDKKCEDKHECDATTKKCKAKADDAQGAEEGKGTVEKDGACEKTEECKDKLECKEKKCVEAEEGSACFAGDSMVITPFGASPMSSLSIGDQVQTASGFEPVVGFLHAEDIEANFYELTTSTGTLPVTHDHLVFKASGEAVYASAIKVGDELSSGVVTEVKQAIRQGIYSPLTHSGTIVVEGTVASSYSYVAHSLSHLIVAPMRFLGMSTTASKVAPMSAFPISA